MALAFGAGAGLTTWIAARGTGSITLALWAAGVQVAIFPRAYSYPKVLIYAVAAAMFAAYAVAPSSRLGVISGWRGSRPSPSSSGTITGSTWPSRRVSCWLASAGAMLRRATGWTPDPSPRRLSGEWRCSGRSPAHSSLLISPTSNGRAVSGRISRPGGTSPNARPAARCCSSLVSIDSSGRRTC